MVGHREVSSLTVKECRIEDAGTYINITKTGAGQITSSPCVVTVEEDTEIKNGTPGVSTANGS